jgi:hypothetical protein
MPPTFIPIFGPPNSTGAGIDNVEVDHGDGNGPVKRQVIVAGDPTDPASVGMPATTAKQDTGNTSLASIDAKTPALVGGRQPVDGSGVTQPVNPTAETAGVGVGAAADAEAAGNGSVIALLKRLRTLIAGGLPAALTGAGSLKVAIAEAIVAGANRIGKVTIRNSADSADIDPLAESTFTGRIPTDPAREGGNLATLAGKDFATSAKQDVQHADLGTIDTDIKATQPRDVTDRAARLLGVVAQGTPSDMTGYAQMAWPVVTVRDDFPYRSQDHELRVLRRMSVVDRDFPEPDLEDDARWAARTGNRFGLRPSRGRGVR